MNKSSTEQYWEFDDNIFSGGAHICYIYNHDDERTRTMTKFFAKGIDSGQEALCFVDTVELHDIYSSLEELGVDISAEDSIFTLADNDTSYCPEGNFYQEKLLRDVTGFYTQANNEGITGARISGDMSWALRKDVSIYTLMEYEIKVTKHLKTTPFTAICECDARIFDGSTIMDILSVHPAMIVRGQVVRTPYIILPKEFLKLYKKRLD